MNTNTIKGADANHGRILIGSKHSQGYRLPMEVETRNALDLMVEME